MHQGGRAGGITLRQLRAFVEVARALSFTRAAARLFVTQSAVSLLVRDLERQLGVPLFVRGRQLQLAEAGEEFLRAATRMLDDLDRAADNLVLSRDARRQVLRLAVGHLLASTLLPAAVADLARERPDLEVVLVDCPVEQVPARVMAAEVDAGIGSLDAERGYPDLRAELLLRDSVHVASAAMLPPLRADGAAAGSVPWRRLQGEPLIVANPANRLWVEVRARLAEQGQALPAMREVAMFSTGVALARHGLGRLLVPGFSTRGAQLEGLTVQPLVRPVMRWDVSLLQRRGVAAPVALEAVLRQVQAQVARR